MAIPSSMAMVLNSAAKKTLICYQLFNMLADFVQMDMSWDKLGEGVDYTNYRLANLLLSHTVGAPEAPGPGHFPPHGCRCTA
jgi:hypothetical protein